MADTTSTVRRPRAIVQVGGQAMPFIAWEIDSNSNYQADTFRCGIAVSALPQNFGMDWWTAQDQLEVEIFAGFPADADKFGVSDLTSIYFGRVDDLQWDLPRGLLDLTGRDLTAVLIDTKTAKKYVTQTASQVAETIAAAHGLTAVVTATKAKVGKYYQIDHVRLQDERSEWDLLTWLAREEGFDVFVKGKELHFQPKAQGGSPVDLKWTPVPSQGGSPRFDGTSITVNHNLTLAKDIRVELRSWNAKAKNGFTVVAEAKRIRNRVTRNAGKPVTPSQVYSYTIPGLERDAAQQRANQLLAELSKHEVHLTVEGPADTSLAITDSLALSGTGTAFDQTFYPDAITRTFSEEDGFRWHIEAKNHSPESVPQV